MSQQRGGQGPPALSPAHTRACVPQAPPGPLAWLRPQANSWLFPLQGSNASPCGRSILWFSGLPSKASATFVPTSLPPCQGTSVPAGDPAIVEKHWESHYVR